MSAEHFGSGRVPQKHDTRRILIAKQVLALNGMANTVTSNPEVYGSGDVPKRSSTERMLTVKENLAT